MKMRYKKIKADGFEVSETKVDKMEVDKMEVVNGVEVDEAEVVDRVETDRVETDRVETDRVETDRVEVVDEMVVDEMEVEISMNSLFDIEVDLLECEWDRIDELDDDGGWGEDLEELERGIRSFG